MHDQNDKPLHDWVRQNLHQYQPADDPQDWERMQRALRQRRWWRTGLTSFVCLLVGGMAGWWVLSGGNRETPKTAVVNTLPKPLLPAHDRVSNSPAKQPAPFKLPVQEVSSARREEVTPVSNPDKERFLVPNLALLESRLEVSELKTNVGENWRQLLASGLSFEERAIRHQMLTGEFGPDSTSYRTLSRNLRRWPNAVIVGDLTTSMYPYSTQLFAWFKQHANHPAVKGVVFFTDCDSLGRTTRPNGPTGQMFVTQEGDVTKVLPVMLSAARNTLHNDDDAENDVEALLYAQKTFPSASHLILLADNASQVKDMTLLDKIRKPVHVVLCGTPRDTTQAFQSDYYAIARHTRGSLHTLEDDLTPNRVAADTWLRVGPRYYRYIARKDRFKVTRFHYRPKRFLGIFWF